MITEQVARDMEYCQLAADWLEANAWTQGAFYDGGTPEDPVACCVIGALNLVMQGSADYVRQNTVHLRLLVSIPPNQRRWRTVSGVNDVKGRTKEEMIYFLRHAGVEKSGGGS